MNPERFYILEKLKEIFSLYPYNIAFFIKGKSYSYREFQNRITTISKFIDTDISNQEKYIGILSQDSLDAYASIVAIWISGKAFVPLNPLNPAQRNSDIINQMGLKHIFYADHHMGLENEALKLLTDTTGLKEFKSEIPTNSVSWESDAYVLFTSGSTGHPKGVRINRRNLDTFYKSYTSFGPEYTQTDRFLQMYDISFDGSVPCYLVALCAGASVYTVPQDEIKYLYALKLIRDNELTVIKMTPSTLSFLRSYFDRIHLPSVRCCIFGGEALPLSITEEWTKCVPNALIQNAYGPTEATIDALMYNFNSDPAQRKSDRGVVSLGKSFGDFKYAVINAKGNQVEGSEEGELCLNGNQLMTSYWNDEKKTNNSFINLNSDSGTLKYYRTGDLVSVDSDGYFMYHGRIDNQVQIQGYRVELGEIENQVQELLDNRTLAAIAIKNTQGVQNIFLFIGGEELPQEPLFLHLNEVLPFYMIPSKIIFLSELPIQVSGKTDRRKLAEIASLYENN